MDVETITVEKDEATKKYKAYAEAVDLRAQYRALKQIYFHLSKGRNILDLYGSFRRAGIKAGLPRIAIAPANEKKMRMEIGTNGISFQRQGKHSWNWHTYVWIPRRQLSKWLKRPSETNRVLRYEAVVPLIPADKRPKRSKYLKDYYILWEVENWKEIPKDPILLRRLTKTLFLVVAKWDLTEVEQRVLEGL